MGLGLVHFLTPNHYRLLFVRLLASSDFEQLDEIFLLHELWVLIGVASDLLNLLLNDPYGHVPHCVQLIWWQNSLDRRENIRLHLLLVGIFTFVYVDIAKA